MKEQPFEFVSIRVQQKPMGIFISSEDVPGLFLWGSDPEAVLADVVPAIERLYKHNRHLDVEVLPWAMPARNSSGELVPHRFAVYRRQPQAGTARWLTAPG